jgi:hypothetical protein
VIYAKAVLPISSLRPANLPNIEGTEGTEGTENRFPFINPYATCILAYGRQNASAQKKIENHCLHCHHCPSTVQRVSRPFDDAGAGE